MEPFVEKAASHGLSSRAISRLRAFRSSVAQALPGRVDRVVLFGSRARGDASRHSDYDVAVFVTDLDNRRVVNHTLSDNAYPHILAGIHIRPLAVPSDFLSRTNSNPLALMIERDGIEIS